MIKEWPMAGALRLAFSCMEPKGTADFSVQSDVGTIGLRCAPKIAAR